MLINYLIIEGLVFAELWSRVFIVSTGVVIAEIKLPDKRAGKRLSSNISLLV